MIKLKDLEDKRKVKDNNKSYKEKEDG